MFGDFKPETPTPHYIVLNRTLFYSLNTWINMESSSKNADLTTQPAFVQLKTPKGTLDFIGTEVKLRKHIL